MSGWQRLWQDPDIAKRWRERPPLPEVVAAADALAAEGRTRVLDIGCGLGRHTVYLAHRGFEVTATDNAPAAIAACRKNLDEAGLHANLLGIDMTEFPFADGCFDLVISTQVIHHSERSTLARIIHCIERKLSPGGVLVWATPTPRHRECGKGREIEPGTWVDDNHREGPVPHHYCTEQEIRDLLAGLEIESLAEREMDGEPTGIWHWYVVARKRQV
ncbi:MAG: class I SAM-dependent methyltransferase [Armatimonadota bacterium]|nr:MAG: class I SAM-dependent methyltransferase [Armatimonadota bacterium]